MALLKLTDDILNNIKMFGGLDVFKRNCVFFSNKKEAQQNQLELFWKLTKPCEKNSLEFWKRYRDIDSLADFVNLDLKSLMTEFIVSHWLSKETSARLVLCLIKRKLKKGTANKFIKKCLQELPIVHPLQNVSWNSDLYWCDHVTQLYQNQKLMRLGMFQHITNPSLLSMDDVAKLCCHPPHREYCYAILEKEAKANNFNLTVLP